MRTILAAILVIAVGRPGLGAGAAAEPTHRPKETGTTYALIVSGINKEPAERRAKDKAVADLSRFLLSSAGVKSDRLGVLVHNTSPAQGNIKISTAENIRKQIITFAQTAGPEDRFVFYYVGQANVVQHRKASLPGETLRLNLPGVDITHEQLAEWVKGIKVSSMLIVLDCPGAGMAVKALAGQNRVVIGACTAKQRYSTRFSEYFIPALADQNSDTDADARISVLEAFALAAKHLDAFYEDQGLLKTETPVLEDDADGTPSEEPWRHEHNQSDGAAASAFFVSGSPQ